jgi:hypothetical protein
MTWRRVAPALALVLVSSCSQPMEVTRERTIAMRRWVTTAPPSYEVVVGRDCFCFPDATRDVVVRVRDGQVESRHYADTGAEVPAAFAALFPTVPELFAIIVEAEVHNAAGVDAQYDPRYGYPAFVFIDHEATLADDEIGYTMHDLHPIE